MGEKPDSHYYIANENMEHQYEYLNYEIKGQTFRFLSDKGVFSKQHVDYATDLLLTNLPQLKGRVLDIGCGYGVIGTVIGKCCPVSVVMIDINSRAAELAKKNAALNGIEACVLISDGIPKNEGSFDAIVTNPPIRAGKTVIFNIYEQAFTHLNPGGVLYLVIQKKHGAESTLKKLEALFSKVNILYKKKGFFIYQAIK